MILSLTDPHFGVRLKMIENWYPYQRHRDLRTFPGTDGTSHQHSYFCYVSCTILELLIIDDGNNKHKYNNIYKRLLKL